MKELFDNLSGYFETKLELIKLDLQSDLSRVVTNLIFAFFILVLAAIVFFFMSFALAEYLNHIYKSLFLGYLLVATSYFTILLIMILLKKYTNLAERLQKYIMTFFDLNKEES
jgi:thiamine transporter ThiT